MRGWVWGHGEYLVVVCLKNEPFFVAFRNTVTFAVDNGGKIGEGFGRHQETTEYSGE